MQPKLLTILLASLFSIILWVFVSFNNNYTTTIKVPLEFTNVKEGNSLLSQSNSDVSLTISGQGWSLAQIAFGPDATLKIPTNENVGIQNYNVRDAIGKNAWLSSSIQVVIVSPTEIYYSIEKLNHKTVPIVANVAIEISEGYGLVSKVKLIPDSVNISGPKSLINSIKSISTEKIGFENSDENTSIKLNLQSIQHVDFENGFTNIEFEVQKIVDKTFNNIPIKIVNVPNLRELNLFPPNIDVTLRGGLQNLGIQDGEGISAVVDFNDAFRDTLGFINPHVTIPEFTTLTNVKPNTLKYIIKQY